MIDKITCTAALLRAASGRAPAAGSCVSSCLRRLVLHSDSDVSSLGLLGLFKDESLVNVRDDSSTSNGGLDEGVELFISSDSELQVSRSDSLDFEVLAGVAGQLEHLSCKILQDGSGVHC